MQFFIPGFAVLTYFLHFFLQVPVRSLRYGSAPDTTLKQNLGNVFLRGLHHLLKPSGESAFVLKYYFYHF